MTFADEIFIGALCSSEELAGALEFDGDTGDFYLYDRSRADGARVTGAIHVLSGRPDFSESDVEVRWSRDEELVGLFVRGRLRAAFPGTETYGGDDGGTARTAIPGWVAASFERL